MIVDELKTQIESRGYWRINFRPKIDEVKIQSLGKVKEILEKTKVSLRGWDYPHVAGSNNERQGLSPGINYYEGWGTMEEHGILEFWRMFQSGQFIHYRSLWEDWVEDTRFRSVRNMWDRDREFKSGEVIGVVHLTLLLTEVYQFLSRLALEGIYKEGVDVSISLNNTASRELVIDSPRRIPFHSPRSTSAPRIEFPNSYEEREILDKPKDLAFDAIIFFFDHFGWHEPNTDVIKSDQEKLLSGQI